MNRAIITTDCPDLTLLHRGKVRDMYAIPGHDDKLLMVATDRISAFDVVMAEPVPVRAACADQHLPVLVQTLERHHAQPPHQRRSR